VLQSRGAITAPREGEAKEDALALWRLAATLDTKGANTRALLISSGVVSGASVLRVVSRRGLAKKHKKKQLLVRITRSHSWNHHKTFAHVTRRWRRCGHRVPRQRAAAQASAQPHAWRREAAVQVLHEAARLVLRRRPVPPRTYTSQRSSRVLVVEGLRGKGRHQLMPRQCGPCNQSDTPWEWRDHASARVCGRRRQLMTASMA
jgi:hypothetical protein